MAEGVYPDRLPRSERNRRAKLDAQWTHALERMRERHSPDATLQELKDLVPRASDIFGAWKNKGHVSYGAVVGYEGADSVVIRLQWRAPDCWIKVVYAPQSRVIRTVLPNEDVARG